MGARAAGKFDEVLSGAGRGVVWSLDWRHWRGRWRGTMLLVMLPQLFRLYTGYSGWQSYSTVVEATTPLLKMVLGTIRMDSSMPQTKAESLAGVTRGVLAYSSLPVSLMQHHGILDNGSVLFRWVGWFWHTHEIVIKPHAFVCCFTFKN